MIENEMTVSVPLEVVKASEIEPKEVKWLWYPYIPFGKVTLLQGYPGDGKSKLMLSIAALLSKGEPLPFTETEENEPMTIIYQTTEDDADDTVVPRFNSAGGNGENLIFIKEDEKSLSFGDNRIAEAIEKYHAKLLILDPMSSYIGENCSMNNANETRAEFNHLIAVAKNTGCAIVIIAHMNKMRDINPLYRTNGSIDIAGQYHRKPFFLEITPAFFFAFLMVDFLNPAASSLSSQSEESISPSFSISKRNSFALISFSFGLPILGARDWNASSAVISISEIKSTPFSATSKRIAEPVGARLDFTCTIYRSAGASLFGVRVIARILLAAPAMSIEPLVRYRGLVSLILFI